jgi:hypothetical protein
MALKYGKCRNFGSCHLADDRVLQEADETDFVCANPDCRGALTQSLGKPSTPDGAQRRLVLLVAGILGLLMLAGGAGYFLFHEPTKSPADKLPQAASLESEEIAPKPMEKWMEEFATVTGSAQSPEAIEPGKYKQAWEAVIRLNSRLAVIQPLKQAGKVVGSESGLLNPALNSTLAPGEQGLLSQENQDRRLLFAFIAEHSSPPVSYERVASEYARNRWREWPPK